MVLRESCATWTGCRTSYAFDEHDALMLQGWVQAQDRLFQLDVLRRQASGTLAELLGAGALSSDVELRTIGLARGAERSLAALSPQTRAGLQAYADGVNAWVQRNPLPIQYAALELTQFRPWTALDCAIIGKALAFQLSFDIDDGATRDFQTYIARLGPQLGQAMFFGDTFRSAPFDKAVDHPRRHRRRAFHRRTEQDERDRGGEDCVRRVDGQLCHRPHSIQRSCKDCGICAGATKPCRS